MLGINCVAVPGCSGSQRRPGEGASPAWRHLPRQIRHDRRAGLTLESPVVSIPLRPDIAELTLWRGAGAS